MKSVRKVVCNITDDMLAEVKGSVSRYTVHSLANIEELSKRFRVKSGLTFYKTPLWELGDDIKLLRRERHIFEVFVGFDSEYEELRYGERISEDDSYHASLNSQHVEGSILFQELDSKKRKEVVRGNKTRKYRFKTVPISYQLSILAPGLDLLHNEIILTGGKKTNFLEIVKRIASHCIEKAVFTNTPNASLRIFLIAHFSLAELQTFEDFHTTKKQFDSIRGTFLTLKSSFEVNLCFEGRVVDVEVVLNDTSLLAPANFQSLAAVGQFIGLEKVSNNHFIEKIGDLLRESPEEFYRYAITDSVITLAYWMGIHQMTQRVIGPKLFQSVGGIAVGYLKAYLKNSKISRTEFFGSNSSNFERYEPFAKDAFMGGRNETFSVGFLNDRVLYDVDLSGAYSTAMMHIPQLNFDEARFTYNIEDFSGVDVVGFGEVDFEFPEDVQMPCIPIKTKGGLIYPRTGSAKCTSYEIYLARNLNAKLKLIAGVVIPPKKSESVLKKFVKDIRSERAKHKKGTLGNNFYKLISNSLYGRFAMGVFPKTYFDTRSDTHVLGNRDRFSNVYIAASITGFIRCVVSELIHELSKRNHLIVSVTTDGFITSCCYETIIKEVNTPFVAAYKRYLSEMGEAPEKYLELKGTTQNLFAWKTRGQYDLDSGVISALAGIQKPKGLSLDEMRVWFRDNVANDSVKVLNEFTSLTSFQSVYNGSPFGRVDQIKYISTRYDFKRKLISLKEVSQTSEERVGEHSAQGSRDYLYSKPWESVHTMKGYIKKYVNDYPKKIVNEASLKDFENYIFDVELKQRYERARKVRLQRGLRREYLQGRALKLCVRHAMHGSAAIFSRQFTSREILNLLLTRGVKVYKQGTHEYKIDSNFMKNQKRLKRETCVLPLTVEVSEVFSIFSSLDPQFNPTLLLIGDEEIKKLDKREKDVLKQLIPSSLDGGWYDTYSGYFTSI